MKPSTPSRAQGILRDNTGILPRLLPLGLREPLGRWFEQRSTSLKGPRMIQESGERMAMTELVNELVGPSPLAGDRVA